ncbi:TolC family protein [Thioclava sp. GXIMD4216]|uniref:TolC family protein n=1 Tax=Thioclava litoralis TaxID=3076557 RepID=A0ABZ1E3Q0_9RHOB|nr:TolC family protein [Thioclava sp. FTW29]
MTSLSGCLGGGTPFPSGRSAYAPSENGFAEQPPGVTAQSSAIIGDLASRRSVLPAGGAYDQVAKAVLGYQKSAAQSELVVKKLTAQAKSKNWLPTLKPGVSLTSLGDLATSIVLDQVLFDNGAKRAEREYAAADVELAAVNLSSDYNDKVYSALAHYIKARQAEAEGAAATQASNKLSEYDNIMRQRVEGGLSDMSEQRVLTQKLIDMQATEAALRDTARSEIAQLESMTGGAAVPARGIDALNIPDPLPDALSVKEAEGNRGLTVAEAKISRAGLLPGLSASASVGSGKPDAGVNLGTSSGFGFGTGDQLKALDAARQSAQQQVEQARQEAYQDVVTLKSKLTAAEAKQGRDANVVAEMEKSLALYTEQYRLGGRSLMELVNQFENYAEMRQDLAGQKYDIALIRLEIARRYGLLVDGSVI